MYHARLLNKIPAETSFLVNKSNSLLKKGIWLYFLLLIFEGALRKWVVPELSTPLLIVRDPIAFWLLFICWKRGLLPSNYLLTLMMLVGIVSIITSTVIGHGNLLVSLYGARIFLVQFPLIFVIGSVLNREDVLRIGKVLMWLSIPMLILITIQFFSPQYAFINRGVGGDLSGSGYTGALGYFRPAGVFSFTNGNYLFFSLVASFVIYFWVNPKCISRPLLVIATFCLVASIPLSISRSLFFHIIITGIFGIVALANKPKFLERILLALLCGAIVLFIISKFTFFQTATDAFTARFVTASDYKGHGIEGVLIDRYFGSLLGPLLDASQLPFFGYGIGMGTNVGSMLLIGDFKYLVSEFEWARIVGELGLLMGAIVIFVRLILSLELALASYNKLLKGDVLPWMLLSYVLLTIPQAQWQQPTTLGFSILIAGLSIASLKNKDSRF